MKEEETCGYLEIECTQEREQPVQRPRAERMPPCPKDKEEVRVDPAQ